MTRFLFTLCAAVSLLLFAAVVAGRLATWWWVRPFGVFYISGESVEWVTITGDTLHAGAIEAPPDSGGPGLPSGPYFRPVLPNDPPRFGARRYPMGGGAIVGMPAWLAAVGLAVLPLWWLRVARLRRRRAKWKATGCCLACGYDLRESPDRCPECGKVTA